jgi:hypothetical protein
VAQEKVQPVVSQVASEMGDNLREPAQQVVESVKSTAADAGQTVADEGRSAAQHVQGRAQDAAAQSAAGLEGPASGWCPGAAVGVLPASRA